MISEWFSMTETQELIKALKADAEQIKEYVVGGIWHEQEYYKTCGKYQAVVEILDYIDSRKEI